MSYLALRKTWAGSRLGLRRNSPRRDPNPVHLPIPDKWRCFRTSSSRNANPSESIDQRKRAVSAQNRRLSPHPSPYTHFLPTCLYHHPHPSNPQGSSVCIMGHSRPHSAVSSTQSPRPSRVFTNIEVSSMPQYPLVSVNPDCAPSTHQSLMPRHTDQYAPKYTQRNRRRRPYLVYPNHRFLCRI